MRRSGLQMLFGLALGAACAAVAADPVTVTTPFFNLENRGLNSLGFAPGPQLRIGANTVLPNGSGGTTAYGETLNLATGQLVRRRIDFTPGPFIPNFFSRYLADDPNLHGSWTLFFNNGSNTTTRNVSLPAGTVQAPFVNSITLSGSSANPIFSWSAPAGTTVNGYRVNIFDKALVAPGNNGQVTSRNLAADQTSYTVTSADFTLADYAFQLDHDYSIEITLIQTKDGSANLNNSNLASVARTYADFRASMASGPAVYLPVTLVDGSYLYNVEVVAGQTYYIDPLVATGYDYRIGAGDPSFLSVILPTDIGDGKYDIFGLDASDNATLLAHDWLGGDPFSFGADGIDAFRIGGIETSAGLDPNDVTAFKTGVAFTGNGMFTGTQTPITTFVAAVPEPETYALMAVGLALLGGLTRRGRLRRS